MKGVGGFYYVHLRNSHFVYECRARGTFRKDGIKPCVGDDCEVDIIDEEAHTGYVVELLPRKNHLIRPLVANCDQVLVVMALKNPKPNLNLLDRFLINMDMQDLRPMIIFNKSDLMDEEEIKEVCAEYLAAGYETIAMSAAAGEDTTEVERLKAITRGKTTVLAGPSGVGKSSIFNLLVGKEQAETGSVSEKIGRGRHTTRHTELTAVDEDTFLLDTPGFSSLLVEDLPEEKLKYYYPEFEPYNDTCRFDGCVHIHEPSCSLIQALEEGKIGRVRYENYVKLYEELKSRRKW